MRLHTWCKQRKGRVGQLARHLGITPAAVYQWINERTPTPVPPTRYRQIVDFSDAQVTFEDLIPPAPKPIKRRASLAEA